MRGLGRICLLFAGFSRLFFMPRKGYVPALEAFLLVSRFRVIKLNPKEVFG